MIDHLSFYATQYDTTKKFYDAALGALGYGVVREMTASWDPEWPTRRICAYGPPGRPIFWLGEVKEGRSWRHLAFAAKNHAEVKAFHAAALAAGGKDDGTPGPRPHYHEHFYGAFVIDPEGNHIEACCHLPA
jgi:catechol 2,3-dioxygenase-like lactoylglutathione lyase family enzyme